MKLLKLQALYNFEIEQKNFLKSFNIKLDNRDEEAIKQKKNKVKIEYYEKNINRFFQENNIIIMNPIKICFLLHIKVLWKLFTRWI